MQISRSQPLTGDPIHAFDLAAHVLVANGFRLERRDAQTLVAIGRGMSSTKQNPLTGAGRIVLTRNGRDLRLQADLGGVLKLTRFLFALPLGILVAFGIVLLAFDNPRTPIPPQAALALAPWLIISPLMVWMMRRRTVRALDDLLASLAVAGAGR